MDSIAQQGEKGDQAHLLKPYQSVRHQFDSEYDRSNPITAEEATKSYFKWMIGKYPLPLLKSNFFLANGYTLSNEAYENVQNDFNIDKGALDQLMLASKHLKANVTVGTENSDRSHKVLGVNDKPGLANIFESFKKFIVEPPLVKFRRIVKEKVMKKRKSPIMELVKVINSLFDKKAPKPKRKFKRRQRRRGNTNLVL